MNTLLNKFYSKIFCHYYFCYKCGLLGKAHNIFLTVLEYWRKWKIVYNKTMYKIDYGILQKFLFITRSLFSTILYRNIFQTITYSTSLNS
jgi:elongation factor P--beta-lysine ligase